MMAKLMSTTTETKPPRQESVSQLFELCVTPDSNGTIKLADFLEYLVFLSPSLAIEGNIAKTTLNNVAPHAKVDAIKPREFERWIDEMEPRLPEGFIDKMLAGSGL